ncbi:alkaline phosphatase family protein, partial [archaeon]
MQVTLLLVVLTVTTLFTRTHAATANLLGRIAFGSCSNPHRDEAIWRQIHSFHPHHLILLGDQIYADRTEHWAYRDPTPAVLEAEYELFFNQHAFQQLLQSVDSFSATFDDHDFGPNNGDKTYQYRDDSIALFRRYYSKLTQFNDTLSSAEANDGVYSAKTIEIDSISIKIIMLDVRSNKDPAPNNFLDPPTTGDFLGETQWTWLGNEFNDPTIDVFLLASPIQVLPDDKALEENWGGFPHARQRLLNMIVAVAREQEVFILS